MRFYRIRFCFFLFYDYVLSFVFDWFVSFVSFASFLLFVFVCPFRVVPFSVSVFVVLRLSVVVSSLFFVAFVLFTRFVVVCFCLYIYIYPFCSVLHLFLSPRFRLRLRFVPLRVFLSFCVRVRFVLSSFALCCFVLLFAPFVFAFRPLRFVFAPSSFLRSVFVLFFVSVSVFVLFVV